MAWHNWRILFACHGLSWPLSAEQQPMTSIRLGHGALPRPSAHMTPIRIITEDDRELLTTARNTWSPCTYYAGVTASLSRTKHLSDLTKCCKAVRRAFVHAWSMEGWSEYSRLLSQPERLSSWDQNKEIAIEDVHEIHAIYSMSILRDWNTKKFMTLEIAGRLWLLSVGTCNALDLKSSEIFNSSGDTGHVPPWTILCFDLLSDFSSWRHRHLMLQVLKLFHSEPQMIQKLPKLALHSRLTCNKCACSTCFAPATNTAEQGIQIHLYSMQIHVTI